MTVRSRAASAARALRRFVLGPWPIHAGALWAFLSSMTLTFTWRLAGPNPMVPQTESLPHRLLVILASGLAGPAAVLVPLIVYCRIRSRFAHTAIRSPEYLLSLAAASLVAAVVLTGVFRVEPLFSGFLGHPGVGLTGIRVFGAVWFMNAVLGSVIVRLQRESRTAHEALQTVVAQRRLLLESEERVRGQVASYLHDRVQTHLVSIGFRIRAAATSGPPEMVRQVDEALAELERVRADEVRKASRQLSPNLRNVALGTALRELADSFRPGMTVTISISPEAAERLQLGGEVTRATGLYRICEQGLLNSAIHGHATDCSIQVSLVERDAYVLEIRDNGVGLTRTPVVPGMGSTVISAWVESLQGEWSLAPQAVGLALTATIPAG